jgi:hypothetical protein
MKKKLPIAPVRANGRGTCAVQDTSIVAVSPGATGCGMPIAITVWSLWLSSSGAMKCVAAVRSTPPIVIVLTSMRAQSPARRGSSSDEPARASSRMNVERLSFQAFQ